MSLSLVVFLFFSLSLSHSLRLKTLHSDVFKNPLLDFGTFLKNYRVKEGGLIVDLRVIFQHCGDNRSSLIRLWVNQCWRGTKILGKIRQIRQKY